VDLEKELVYATSSKPCGYTRVVGLGADHPATFMTRWCEPRLRW
jgi:hypothetical protein